MAGPKQTRRRVTDRTAHQIESIATLFIEATGIREALLRSSVSGVSFLFPR